MKEFTQAQKEWLDALKSGKYQQGENFLKFKHSQNEEFAYCCLGVAHEIFQENLDLPEIRNGQQFIDPPVEKHLNLLDGHGSFLWDTGEERQQLRDALLDVVGEPGESVLFIKNCLDLASLNDVCAEAVIELNQSRPFDIVIRFIEKYPQFVFTNFRD